MLKSKIARGLGIGVATLTAVAAVGITAGGASAATIGTLSFAPATGNNLSLITATSSAACPGGTNLYIKLTGPGFPAAVAGSSSGGYSVSGNAAQSSFPTAPNGGKIVALQNHFQNFADSQTPPATLGGLYTVTMYCQNNFGTVQFGEFVGQINFSSPTAYAAVVSTTPTSTAIAASPASPSTAGTAVTFTATVSPATPGSVQFMDGAAALGSPVTVAGGTAALTTSALSVATHSITAVFTSSDPAFAGSTSAATSYVVTAVPAPATTTTLTAPATAPAFTAVPLHANVTTTGPGTPAGSVNFLDGASVIGNAPLTAVGADLTTSSLAQGTHSLTATFVPSNNFQPSTSAAVTHTSTAPQFLPDVQDIKATVDAGTLTITTPYHKSTGPGVPDTTLDLGHLVLNAGGTMLSTNAPFTNIVITDTRAGNGPWTASASATNLTSGANIINGQNLGLTGLTPTYTPGNALQAGSVTTVQNPAASPAVAPADPGSLGLKNGPHTIATAVNGTGTVTLNGTMTLNAPTSTAAGLYTGTVTFTVA